MAEFVIKIPDVPVDGQDLDVPIRAAWLGHVLSGTDLRASNTGRLKVRVERTGDDVLVRGRARATLVTQCCRCLEDADVAADAEIVSLFEARTARPSGHPVVAGEDEGDDLVRLSYAGDEIVLDEIVRDALILEVPMKPLCRASCPGIEVPAHVRPPTDFGSGAPGDVDPRLAPLKKIRVAHNKD